MAGHDRSISEVFVRQRSRLRGFIRKRVPDPADAEDTLQEVFYELVEAARLVRPVEQVGAWLFRVARNRITDLFPKKENEPFEVPDGTPLTEPADLAGANFEDLLPAAGDGPESAYARRLLLEELDAAWTNCPTSSATCSLPTNSRGAASKSLLRAPVSA